MTTSELNLTIFIEHDEDLPFDAEGITSEITRVVAHEVEGTKGRRAVLRDGRNHLSGPVRTFLRSAFFTRFEKASTGYLPGEWPAMRDA